MQTSQQHFAASRILSSLDSGLTAHAPEGALRRWQEGALSQTGDWKRRALGVALALSREGHFEWEDFRQALLTALGTYQSPVEASWEFCQKWLLALESVVGTAGLVDAGTLAELRALAQHAESSAIHVHEVAGPARTVYTVG